jgi:hypothetical protein
MFWVHRAFLLPRLGRATPHSAGAQGRENFLCAETLPTESGMNRG